MSCCPHCVDSRDLFGDRTARRDLKRYRKRGMRKSTEMLVDALKPYAAGATLLDIGGGVGMVQRELMDAGLERATQVDASKAYLEASRREAERRGHLSRTELVFGDFAELAPELGSRDIVVLDRVVCCYPDAPSLVSLSVASAREVIGLVAPRRRLGIRLLVRLANLFFRARGSAFRTFVHPPSAVEAIIESNGFEPVCSDQTIIWNVLVFRRRSDQVRPPAGEGH